MKQTLRKRIILPELCWLSCLIPQFIGLVSCSWILLYKYVPSSGVIFLLKWSTKQQSQGRKYLLPHGYYSLSDQILWPGIVSFSGFGRKCQAEGSGGLTSCNVRWFSVCMLALCQVSSITLNVTRIFGADKISPPVLMRLGNSYVLYLADQIRSIRFFDKHVHSESLIESVICASIKCGYLIFFNPYTRVLIKDYRL